MTLELLVMMYTLSVWRSLLVQLKEALTLVGVVGERKHRPWRAILKAFYATYRDAWLAISEIWRAHKKNATYFFQS